jgi:hypothetical protein
MLPARMDGMGPYVVPFEAACPTVFGLVTFAELRQDTTKVLTLGVGR